MQRKRFIWKVREREITLGDRTLVMGILNVTPDSFSDGGKYSDPSAAAERAIELQEAGADILDIGAESTRPGSVRISGAEELRRLIPVLKRLAGKLDIPISIDTYKPEVAEVALDNGAEIINDPSGLTWEPELAKVALYHNAGLILNHTRGTPDTWAKQPPLHDVLGSIRSELEASFNRARGAGVERERIVIDPGFGFGKRQEQNSEIVARLGELEPLLLPILVGPSRKSFLAKPTENETEFATAAAVALCIWSGAHIVRVHDVTAMRAAVQVVDGILSVVPMPKSEQTPAKRAPRGVEGGMRGPNLDDESRRRPIAPPPGKKVAAPVKDVEPGTDAPPERTERSPASRPPQRTPDRMSDRPFRAPRKFPDREDRPAWSGAGPGQGRPARSGGPPAGRSSDGPARRGPGGGSAPPRRGPGGPPRPGGSRPPSSGGRPPAGGGGRPGSSSGSSSGGGRPSGGRPPSGRPPSRGGRPPGGRPPGGSRPPSGRPPKRG